MDLVKLKAQLVTHEGFKLFPYFDSVGKLTIGVGHNLSDRGLTPKQINLILEDDVNDTLGFLGSHFPWFSKLDEVRQRAILDLTFDLEGKLLEFKRMIVALEGSEWNVASTELLNSKFSTQTGKRAVDLAHMILTGQDT